MLSQTAPTSEMLPNSHLTTVQCGNVQCGNVQCGKDIVDDTCSPTTLNTHLGRMNSMCCPSVELVIIWQPVATIQDIFSHTTRKTIDKASVCHRGKEGYNNGRPGPSCTFQPLVVMHVHYSVGVLQSYSIPSLCGRNMPPPTTSQWELGQGLFTHTL